MDTRPRKAMCLVLVSWALVQPAGRLRADDWPAYQKDARRSAVSGDRLSLPLAAAWVYRAGQPPQPAWTEPGRAANPLDFDAAFQPVVAGGMAYFSSSADDTVYALAAGDGSVRWTFTAAAPLRFAPHIDNGRCYFAGDDGVIYCRDARSGQAVWEFQAAPEQRFVSGNGRMISRWPCRSGVLVLEGTVYATAGMWPAEGTHFYALDAQTGRVKWCQDTLNALYLAYPHDGLSFGGPTPQGYLLSDGQLLVVPTGQSAPAVLDARTGKFLYWHQQSPGSSWASLSDGLAMVAGLGWQPDQDLRLGESPLFRGDGVAFYDLATGQVTGDSRWRQYDNLPGSVRHNLPRWRGQVTPLGGRDRVVMAGERCYASGMGAIEGLDCAGPQLRRLWQIPFPRVYGLAVADNLLLAGGDRCVLALDGGDGRVLWRGAVDGQARGLAIADGVLYVATDRGSLYAFATGRRAPLPLPPADPSTPMDALPRTGYGLVVGSRDTHVAEQLALESTLNVICLLSDPNAVGAARLRLLGRGYGRRVVVHPVPPDGQLPYADFFANEVVLDGGTGGVRPEELYRVLQPCTGWLRLAEMTDTARTALLQQAGIPPEEVDGEEVRRGSLPGAFDWDSPGQVDQRVQWPLELLWFGGPGRERTMTRHRQDLPPPVAACGRLFVLGDGHVTAVDAYNGCELWSRRAPGYRYVSANDRSAYIGLGDRVMQCDAQSGRLEKIWGSAEPVVYGLDQPQVFSAANGDFSGSLTVRRGTTGLELQLNTGTPQPDAKDCWTLWFDFRQPEQRLLPAGRGAFPIIVNAATATLRKFDGFAAAAIPEVDLQPAGEGLLLTIPYEEIQRLTARPLADVELSAEISLYREFELRLRARPITGSRDPWQDGTATFVLAAGDEVLPTPLADVPREALGQLPAHARTWGRTPLHVRHDGNIPGPPLASRLTPSLNQRLNPLTGEASSRCYLRGYGCSGTIASANMDFFRSGTLGMYDLLDDSGMRNFPGVRPGCRITMLPALGLLLSAEGVGDCFCPYNFSTSLALAPTSRRRHEDWALFVAPTRNLPLQQVALNLGAPGDRRDDAGQIWLGYPRQPMMYATGGSFGPRQHADGLPAVFETFGEGRPIRVNADRVPIAGPDPWIAASAVEGIRRISLGLVYNEPGTSCLALPASAEPLIDASLDDPAWSGEPGIPISVQPNGLVDRGRVRVRYDAKNLYLAYEQLPLIDRRGASESWDGAYFDVLLKDVAASAYAQFRITSGGQMSALLLSNEVPVPPAADTGMEDGTSPGAELPLDGRGKIQLGWNSAGLLLRLILSQVPPEGRWPGLRLQFANLEDPAAVDLVVHSDGSVVHMLEAVLATDEPSATTPFNVLPPASQGWEYFRGSRPLVAPVAVADNAAGMTFKAIVPWDRLKIKPEIGAKIAFQAVTYDPASPDQNIAGGGGARRALFSSGSALSLTLAAAGSGTSPPAALPPKRDWFGSVTMFAARRQAVHEQAWNAAVAGDERSWRAELAVPWDVLGPAGLTCDRLLAQFRTPEDLPADLELLSQRFKSRALRLHTRSEPPRPADYLVRLHFAELEEVAVGQRVFDIRLQGRLVAQEVDVVREAGGVRRPLVKSFLVSPAGELDIEFVPRTGTPLLNGLQVSVQTAAGE